MGTAPPKDAPPPEEQNQAAIEAGFEPSPTGAALCGFGFPLFGFSLTLPAFGFAIGFPNLNLSLTLSCDLSNPISADFEFGGGRIASFDKDQDDQFAEG